jgi:hypothetical protein
MPWPSALLRGAPKRLVQRLVCRSLAAAGPSALSVQAPYPSRAHECLQGGDTWLVIDRLLEACDSDGLLEACRTLEQRDPQVAERGREWGDAPGVERGRLAGT